jgi:hypothetical protein
VKNDNFTDAGTIYITDCTAEVEDPHQVGFLVENLFGDKLDTEKYDLKEKRKMRDLANKRMSVFKSRMAASRQPTLKNQDSVA